MYPRCAMGGLGLLIGLSLLGCSNTPPPKPEVGPLAVTVSRPFVDKVTTYATLTGRTDAVETVSVRPRVSGYITAVKFKEGDDVEGGKAVLFEIDPVTYDADLKKAKAQEEVTKAKLDLAKANEAREKLAYDNGATSKQNYDTFVAQRKVAEAELLSVQNDVVNAKQNLDWTKVVAPISGKAGRALLTKGNVATGGVSQGTELTTIVNYSPNIYAYFDVTDQQVQDYDRAAKAGKLQPAADGKSVIELGLQKGTDYPFKGAIDFVSNRIEPSTGSLQIRGVFPNPGGKDLRPGYFVRARVPLGAPADAILVPESAVVTEQANKLVLVVNADNKVEARLVRLGPTHRGLRVIHEGLKPDDRVVIRGLQRVRPGSTVAPEDGKIEPEATAPR